MKQMILKPACLDGYSPRKDGSFSLRFITQECTPEEVANFAALYGQFGYFLFKPQITVEDKKMMDELDTEINDGKTPSKRLRGVLYVEWQQDALGYSDFKSYYKMRMEQIINRIKDNLE
jgi:hypothetical protein